MVTNVDVADASLAVAEVPSLFEKCNLSCLDACDILQLTTKAELSSTEACVGTKVGTGWRG